MNREIKFRYWNGITKIMVNEPEIRSDYQFSLNKYFTDRGWTWMQFIVKEDGNEIYEGDIIQEIKHEEVVRVFVANDIRTFTREYDKSGHGSIFKVIGNIFENKNLLDNCRSCNSRKWKFIFENPELLES